MVRKRSHREHCRDKNWMLGAGLGMCAALKTYGVLTVSPWARALATKPRTAAAETANFIVY
jgi:hypothetical protein